MSTLRVDNLQASDGLSPAFNTSGIAKVWANYDQTVPSTVDSYNVSSISDDAAGGFTVNATNAMADANGLRIGHILYPAANVNNRTCGCYDATITTSAAQFWQGNGTTEQDRQNHSFWLGDLA